jgi:hypothetical protein
LRASESPFAFETEETEAQSEDDDDEQGWAGGIGAAAHGEEEHGGEEPAGEEDGSGRTQRQPRPCELYVCNLPRRYGVDELHELFGPHGTVLSVEVHTHLRSTRSRACSTLKFVKSHLVVAELGLALIDVKSPN